MIEEETTDFLEEEEEIDFLEEEEEETDDFLEEIDDFLGEEDEDEDLEILVVIFWLIDKLIFSVIITLMMKFSR